MNILFYIEPRIERGNPYLRFPWLKPFCIELVRVIYKSKSKINPHICIATTELFQATLEKEFPHKEIQKVYFSQKDLYPNDDINWLKLSTYWYREDYSDKILSHYLDLMRKKFCCFYPDIIITFSPIPFLKILFNHALILHHEVSFISNAPYPVTWYLDPFGMVFQSKSFFCKYAPVAQRLSLSESQQGMVKRFKNKCDQTIRKKSPFKAFFKSLKQKFEALALLPLSRLDTYPLFAKYGNQYINQYDYISSILARVPKQIGLVVVPRPDAEQVIPIEATHYLKREYDNFIYEKNFLTWDAPSQYALSHVDYIIGEVSSLCLQSLIWDVPLVSLGDYKCISDIDSISKMGFFDSQINKDSLLFWLITRYAVTRNYLHDSDWFANYLNRSLTRFRNGAMDFSFYDPIDDEKKIFKSIEQQFELSAPYKNKRNVWYQFFDDPGLVEVIPEVTEQLREQSIAGKVLLKVFSHIQEGCIDTAITLFADELDGRLIHESALQAFPHLTYEMSRWTASDKAVHQLLRCFDCLYLKDATRQQAHWAVVAQHIHNMAIRLLHNSRWAAASESLERLQNYQLTIIGGEYALSVALYNQGRREEARTAAMKELSLRPEHRRARILVEMIDGRRASDNVFAYSSELA